MILSTNKEIRGNSSLFLISLKGGDLMESLVDVAIQQGLVE